MATKKGGNTAAADGSPLDEPLFGMDVADVLSGEEGGSMLGNADSSAFSLK